MKLGKFKISFSIFCLTAALVFAAFTVYAWFIIFQEVSAGNIDSVIASGDVISFEIDYYYTSSEDGVDYTIEDKITVAGGDESALEMHDYTPRIGIGGGTDTAVLLHMTLTFSKSGDFYLASKITSGGVYDDSDDGAAPDEDALLTDFRKFTTKNYLSNVVCLQQVEVAEVDNLTGEAFTVRNPNPRTFVTSANEYFNGDDDKKSSSVDLLTYSVANSRIGENEVHHLFFLVDYVPQQISALYTAMLQSYPRYARLDTRINFQQDIFFEIGKTVD